MAKQDPEHKFTPTPPSSAKPISGRRVGMKILAASSPEHQMRANVDSAAKATRETSSLSSTGRNSSFSSYGILPPIHMSDDAGHKQLEKNATYIINGDNNRQFALRGTSELDREKFGKKGQDQEPFEKNLVAKYNDQRKFISSSTKDGPVERKIEIKEGRRLYRKGEIFKLYGTEHSTSGDIRNAEKTTSQSKSNFHYSAPEEPGMGEDRLLVAFRTPGGERLQRYFSPSDRIGDVLIFLKDSLDLNSGNFSLQKIELFTNDVPKRKLADFEATLSKCGLLDRTILNVMLLDDT